MSLHCPWDLDAVLLLVFPLYAFVFQVLTSVMVAPLLVGYIRSPGLGLPDEEQIVDNEAHGGVAADDVGVVISWDNRLGRPAHSPINTLASQQNN